MAIDAKHQRKIVENYIWVKKVKNWHKSGSPTNGLGISKNDGKSSMVQNLESDTKVIRACEKPTVK